MTEPRAAAGEDEWGLVLAACLVFAGRAQPDRFEHALAALDGRVGRGLELAVRHGLLPLLAHVTDELELLDDQSRPLRRFLRETLAANRRRVETLTGEARRVASALADRDVRCACTKGVALAATVYRGSGARSLGDVDLMIEPSAGAVAVELLRELGYQPGVYDPLLGILAPLPPRDAALYRLSPDHLPHHHRLLEDSLTPVATIDIAYSLTWHDSEWDVPVAAVLQERCALPGDAEEPLWCLVPWLELLFTMLHLFREAWFERTGTDFAPRLRQFLDVVLIWDCLAVEEQRRAREVVHARQVQAPVAWVAAHCDAVLGTSLVEALDLGSWATAEWTSSSCCGGRVRSWSGDMTARLASHDPGAWG